MLYLLFTTTEALLGNGSICDEFDKAWEEGTMFLLTMHPHVSGHRSRIVALKGLIDHIQAKGEVWFATHEDAARYVRDQAGMN